jgi:DNA-binding transcriptional regulator/RsmH inhibitor MraZ
MEYAKSINLIGEGASLENWDKYAWVYPLQQSSTPVENSQAKQAAAAKEAAEVKYYNDRYGEA